MCLLTFIPVSPQLQGFPNISPWAFISGWGGGFILGVKNKLRNAWTYFQLGGGGLVYGRVIFGVLCYIKKKSDNHVILEQKLNLKLKINDLVK